MVKSYLRYEPAASFGVIVSGESNITYDSSGNFIVAPALEKVGIWNVRQGECKKTLVPEVAKFGPSAAVTSLAASHSSQIACGYADGSVRIWNLEDGTCETTLNGHKRATTVLRYNKIDSLLASGSKDNDIILWDVVGETGLFRLQGHRDQVTDLVFLDSGRKLVSSSKDKFLRVWDLDTQYCMQIIGGHHSEIWSIDVDPAERYLVSGSADQELRFYLINLQSDESTSLPKITGTEAENGESLHHNKWDVLKHFGDIPRQNNRRVATVRFNNSGNLLACQIAGKIVDVFSVLDDAEAKRKAKRRLKRKKEKKSSNKGDEVTGIENTDHVADESSVLVTDVFKHLCGLRAKHNICSVSFCPVNAKNALALLALSLNNNTLEFYSVMKDSAEKATAIELPGNHAIVRSVTLSSDDSLLMSTCDDAIKFWNPSSGSCLRTIDSKYGLCSLFVPHNKYALVGTKDGMIEIIDIGSGTRIEEVKAHSVNVKTIVPIPNEDGFVTGSSDHDVKFWQYETVQKPGLETKHLTVSNTRTLSMNDDVICVAISPDAKYIAIALLDSTVKVYYVDSLKGFVTLYGHKLTVLCMDISSDGDLIVTGSADKNIKIWGLDFGDCHKSIFAHSDSVMAVKFVRNTHYMFSVGADRLVKYWDADKFELLLTLEGHHDRVSSLAVSSRGDYIVTGSHDRSIRRWDRTTEPFFIEEEKEKRLEEMFEADLEGPSENKYGIKEEIPEEGAVALAGKKTIETLSKTDLLVDALDIAEVETKRIIEHEEAKAAGRASEFQSNIIMGGRSPSDYVLHTVSSVHTNDLEQTLLALPFSDALKLISYLKDWTSNPDTIETVCRIAMILVQTHHSQLIATQAARPLLSVLKEVLSQRVKECKDTIGFNLAAMDHIKQLMGSKSDAPFRDAKAKLAEVRLRLSKNTRLETREHRLKKKQKKTNKPLP
ncbi:unnamed protein product [Rhodiola kirilowii]